MRLTVNRASVRREPFASGIAPVDEVDHAGHKKHGEAESRGNVTDAHEAIMAMWPSCVSSA